MRPVKIFTFLYACHFASRESNCAQCMLQRVESYGPEDLSDDSIARLMKGAVVKYSASGYQLVEVLAWGMHEGRWIHWEIGGPLGPPYTDKRIRNALVPCMYLHRMS